MLKRNRLATSCRALIFAAVMGALIHGFMPRAPYTLSNSDALVSRRWSKSEIVQHLAENPDRAFFADVFRYGGFKSGIEVGVANGRFSEHFLKVNSGIPISWHMVEPFPNAELKSCFGIRDGEASFKVGRWQRENIGAQAELQFSMKMSTDVELLDSIADNSIDFVYLDGAHEYEVVKLELPLFFPKVRRGGVLAGHDYCNHGQPGSDRCNGCRTIPLCQNYTEYGMRQGKPPGIASDQVGVVRAVQEYLVDNHPKLRIHHTSETFTRESLYPHRFSYDLLITSTRNPSWFIIKP